VPSESPSLAEASELRKSYDSFGTANTRSFKDSGKYVLVAFLRSFHKLEISVSEETRIKLKTSSFVDDQDVVLE
jgi:hypothetical protein